MAGVVWVRAGVPVEPVTVTVNVVLVEHPAVRVTVVVVGRVTLGEDTEAEQPVGRGEGDVDTVSVTVPVKPFTAATVIVVLPVKPTV
jgi:hypothetical protein